MTGRSIRRHEMLGKVSAFGLTRAETFPPGTLGDELFAAVGLAVRQLQEHAAIQASAHARAAASGKADARALLRARLRRISATARGMAVDMPAVAGTFRVPKTNGDRALLAAARAFALGARPLERTFTDHCLPSTFLADLQADIAAMEQASRQYEALKQQGVAASAGVGAALARAHGSLRRLDAVVLNVCRGDAGAIAAWKAARHEGGRRRAAEAAAGAGAAAPLRLVSAA